MKSPRGPRKIPGHKVNNPSIRNQRPSNTGPGGLLGGVGSMNDQINTDQPAQPVASPHSTGIGSIHQKFASAQVGNAEMPPQNSLNPDLRSEDGEARRSSRLASRGQLERPPNAFNNTQQPRKISISQNRQKAMNEGWNQNNNVAPDTALNSAQSTTKIGGKMEAYPNDGEDPGRRLLSSPSGHEFSPHAPSRRAAFFNSPRESATLHMKRDSMQPRSKQAHNKYSDLFGPKRSTHQEFSSRMNGGLISPPDWSTPGDPLDSARGETARNDLNDNDLPLSQEERIKQSINRVNTKRRSMQKGPRTAASKREQQELQSANLKMPLKSGQPMRPDADPGQINQTSKRNRNDVLRLSQLFTQKQSNDLQLMFGSTSKLLPNRYELQQWERRRNGTFSPPPMIGSSKYGSTRLLPHEEDPAPYSQVRHDIEHAAQLIEEGTSGRELAPGDLPRDLLRGWRDQGRKSSKVIVEPPRQAKPVNLQPVQPNQFITIGDVEHAQDQQLAPQVQTISSFDRSPRGIVASGPTGLKPKQRSKVWSLDAQNAHLPKPKANRVPNKKAAQQSNQAGTSVKNAKKTAMAKPNAKGAYNTLKFRGKVPKLKQVEGLHKATSKPDLILNLDGNFDFLKDSAFPKTVKANPLSSQQTSYLATLKAAFHSTSSVRHKHSVKSPTGQSRVNTKQNQSLKQQREKAKRLLEILQHKGKLITDKLNRFTHSKALNPPTKSLMTQLVSGRIDLIMQSFITAELGHDNQGQIDQLQMTQNQMITKIITLNQKKPKSTIQDLKAKLQTIQNDLINTLTENSFCISNISSIQNNSNRSFNPDETDLNFNDNKQTSSSQNKKEGSGSDLQMAFQQSMPSATKQAAQVVTHIIDPNENIFKRRMKSSANQPYDAFKLEFNKEQQENFDDSYDRYEVFKEEPRSLHSPLSMGSNNQMMNELGVDQETCTFHRSSVAATSNQDIIRERLNRAKELKNARIQRSRIGTMSQSGNTRSEHAQTFADNQNVDIKMNAFNAKSNSLHQGFHNCRHSLRSADRPIQSNRGGMKGYLNHVSNQKGEEPSAKSLVMQFDNSSVQSPQDGRQDKHSQVQISKQDRADIVGQDIGESPRISKRLQPINQLGPMDSHSQQNLKNKNQYGSSAVVNLGTEYSASNMQKQQQNQTINTINSMNNQFNSTSAQINNQINSLLNKRYGGQGQMPPKNIQEQNMDLESQQKVTSSTYQNAQRSMKQYHRSPADDILMDTEENIMTTHRQQNDQGLISDQNLLQFDNELGDQTDRGAQVDHQNHLGNYYTQQQNNGRLLMENDNEYDVPDEDSNVQSNLKSVNKSLEKSVISQSQGQGINVSLNRYVRNASGNRSGNRNLYSQMQVRQSRSPLRNQGQQKEDLSTDNDDAAGANNNYNVAPNTTSNQNARKQNYDLSGFNSIHNSAVSPKPETEADIRTKKSVTNPHQVNVTQYKQMLTARDKCEEFNLPGQLSAAGEYLQSFYNPNTGGDTNKEGIRSGLEGVDVSAINSNTRIHHELGPQDELGAHPVSFQSNSNVSEHLNERNRQGSSSKINFYSQDYSNRNSFARHERNLTRPKADDKKPFQVSEDVGMSFGTPVSSAQYRKSRKHRNTTNQNLNMNTPLSGPNEMAKNLNYMMSQQADFQDEVNDTTRHHVKDTMKDTIEVESKDYIELPTRRDDINRRNSPKVQENSSRYHSSMGQYKHEQFQRAKNLINSRKNKFEDGMDERVNRGKMQVNKAIGRSLSKYSNLSKISITQSSGPTRNLRSRQIKVRAFSNDEMRKQNEEDPISRVSERSPGRAIRQARVSQASLPSDRRGQRHKGSLKTMPRDMAKAGALCQGMAVGADRVVQNQQICECQCNILSQQTAWPDRKAARGAKVPRKPAHQNRMQGGEVRSSSGMHGQNSEDDEYRVSLSASGKDPQSDSGDGEFKVCGEYCKNLTPEQERQYIIKCLIQNIKEYKVAQDDMSNNSVTDSEIEKLVQSNNSINLMAAQENDKRYLISANWWREWCDYADFDVNQLAFYNQSQGKRGRGSVYKDIIHRNQNLSPRAEFPSGARRRRDQRNRNVSTPGSTSKQHGIESTILQIKPSLQLNRKKLAQWNNKQSANNEEGFLINPSENEKTARRSKARSPREKHSIGSSKSSKGIAQNGLNADRSVRSHDSRVRRKSKASLSNCSSNHLKVIDKKESIQMPLDSAKQREADFKIELKNLKEQFKLERQQMKADQIESASNGPQLHSPGGILNSDRGQADILSEGSQRRAQVIRGFSPPNRTNTVIGRVGMLSAAAQEADPNLMSQNMLYKKPTLIRNQPLLRDQNTQLYGSKQLKNMYLFLKDDLIEHFDYEAVSLEVWQRLKAWYECDVALLRFIKRDGVNRNQVYLDLYPEKRAGGAASDGLPTPNNQN